MATWAEFERAEPEIASFGRDKFDGQVVFHATLRSDGAPRLHPVSPWFGAGLLAVAFRARSPKVDEILRDGRYAMHSLMDNHDGEGGEFLVQGWMEQVAPDHPVANARPYTASYPLATYACSIEEAVLTTYDGDTPVYRRWKG
ncbi:MAG TPA: hypothetical protein VGR41_10230 [Actinomycetota bacterium]|jgi:hypothetical protein|nr:hypothetical protein [Actinomycetota bacterium]